ncbi:MAG: hypothetical protein ACR650_11375 [Methylocystis sp.]
MTETLGQSVTAGLAPAVHAQMFRLAAQGGGRLAAWMPAASAGMTRETLLKPYASSRCA